MVFQKVAVGDGAAGIVDGHSNHADRAFRATDGVAQLFDNPVAVGIYYFIKFKVPGPGKPGHADRRVALADVFEGALFVRPKTPKALVGNGVDSLADAVGNIKRAVSDIAFAVKGDVAANVVDHRGTIDGGEFVAVGLIACRDPRFGQVTQR